MRLRNRRQVHAGRRPRRWRIPLTGGVFALIVGAACWAPLAPTALAPIVPGEVNPAALAPAPTAVPAAPPAAVVVPPVVPVAPTPTPAPAVSLAPVVVPTLTAAGQVMLTSILSDRWAIWLKNHAETPLRSGPTVDSSVFTRLPQWSTLKQIDSRTDWLMVEYGGDGQTRLPGPGWVKVTDVGRIDAPSIWLSSARAGTVWTTADASGTRVVDMPPSTLMEVIGPDIIQGTRVHVRLPGNGRQVPPSTGWVDGDGLLRTRTPSVTELPWAYPEALTADVRINVPYRTQLDGSDYAGANCGPTVLGMALETFGVNLPPFEVRSQVLDTEQFSQFDDEAGSFIWALARVAQRHGLQVNGLYETGGALHRWSLDEVRDSLRRGQPVIAQVVYRGLPEREDSSYYGDHYIILTGLVGENFLYNDPIGGREAREAPGWDRMMTPTQLRRAMRASDAPYAFTAFSLSRT
jgi:Peptidase_C39 like family